jgi:hypothetical protein
MPLADAASYPLWVNAALFLVGAAVVWVAGTRLARHAAAIGDMTGLEPAGRCRFSPAAPPCCTRSGSRRERPAAATVIRNRVTLLAHALYGRDPWLNGG